MTWRAVLLVAVATSGAAGALALASDSVVTVQMADFAFALTPRAIDAGPVTFRVKNVGAVQHDFEIVGQKKTEILDAGGSEDLHAVLEPGKYEIRCTVPGHAEAGMKGVLEVR